jgi:uncharacterized integral membrane protein
MFQKLVRANPTRSFRTGMVIGGLLALATFMLIVQNGESARLNWVFWDLGAPLWIFLLLAALAGAALLQLGVLLWRHGRRAAAERQKAGGQLQKLISAQGPAASPTKPKPPEAPAGVKTPDGATATRPSPPKAPLGGPSS